MRTKLPETWYFKVTENTVQEVRKILGFIISAPGRYVGISTPGSKYLTWLSLQDDPKSAYGPEELTEIEFLHLFCGKKIKIIGYECPTDLGGYIKAGTIFKLVKSDYGKWYANTNEEHADNMRLPSEIVEQWEPI